MANTHGGLVLVGITDEDREIVGVPREVITNVAGIFATHLDPADWLPDMREVAIDDKPGRYVLVIRVDRNAAPRPIFAQRRDSRTFWAPIRMPAARGRPPATSCGPCTPRMALPEHRIGRGH
jgi:predicted HTH transcriptional regulator